MRIAIPDDYQNLVHTLRCYSLLEGHEVIRYREPAADLADFARRLHTAEAIVPIRERSRFPRELIERLPNLKVISQTGRSTRHIDVGACTERGILVTAGTHASPIAPAEMTWALILASRRHVPLEIERMKRGEWPCTLSHRLSGSTLGIFGLGMIGTLVARIGAAFGMNVLVLGRENSARRARDAGYDVAADKAELFERSDVLCLLMRMTPETKGLVTRADLARMKPTALLVNTARADLIEEGALVEALRAGRPGFAAVDVYEKEPVIAANHPLLAMPNVLCTHHVAWAEHDTFELYFGEAFENLLAYAQGAPRSIVNPDVLKP
ncbi:MAG: D-2-hydroxyacid dehydrogenase family protein [Betaproteobacteria bacterium]|nr:MAG: D-2-hydroxyacid dehydrogenase family protein [Betaproteobacteria bacterium]